MPVRLLPFFVEIQNARVWPFVIPPVRSARLQDVFPYGNCTETRKIRRGTFTGFSHDGQPLGAYPVFSDLQAKVRQLRLLHRGTPSPAQRGIFRGSDVRRIQNYLSGEATRTFRYPRSQVFRDFKNLCGIPVNAAAAFAGGNGTHCRNAALRASNIADSHGLDQAHCLLLRASFSVSPTSAARLVDWRPSGGAVPVEVVILVGGRD